MQIRSTRLTWASLAVVLLFMLAVAGVAEHRLAPYGSCRSASPAGQAHVSHRSGPHSLASRHSGGESSRRTTVIVRAVVGQGSGSDAPSPTLESLAVGIATPESHGPLGPSASQNQQGQTLVDYASRVSRTRGQPTLV